MGYCSSYPLSAEKIQAVLDKATDARNEFLALMNRRLQDPNISSSERKMCKYAFSERGRQLEDSRQADIALRLSWPPEGRLAEDISHWISWSLKDPDGGEYCPLPWLKAAQQQLKNNDIQRAFEIIHAGTHGRGGNGLPVGMGAAFPIDFSDLLWADIEVTLT